MFKQAPARRGQEGMSRVRTRAKRRRGFTLTEMMVTVALIGFLGSLAYPNYALFVAKSHRSEAILALSAIYKWQLAYYTANGRYADTFDQLGFELIGAQRVDARTLQARIYTYTMTSLSQNGKAGANYQAVATGDIDPNDPVLDVLMIENDLTVGP
jgi:prepilin-type N-terminal cleavage/methylation domain-containing protein